jgi:hypothetical protein
MSFEEYKQNIADKAKELRRQEALATMRPLYDAARQQILPDLKQHGLVEAILRHEKRKLALDLAVTDTLRNN